MSAALSPTSRDALIASAARAIVKLNQQHLVAEDGTVRLPSNRMPTALVEMRRALDATAGTPEGEALEAAFGKAVSDALEADRPQGINIAGPASTPVNAASGGATPGSTSRLDLRDPLPKAGIHQVNGKQIRVTREADGIRYFEIKNSGREVALAYNPFRKRELNFVGQVARDGLHAALVYPRPYRNEDGKLRLRMENATARGKENRAKFKAYKKNVNEIMKTITDEDLMWTFSRLPGLQLQEGILRRSASPNVNKWPHGRLATECSPSDFDGATVSRDAIVYMLKQAMDTELPAVPYSWASAHTLHNYFHNVAHFMGSTMDERIIASALNGGKVKRELEATWMVEEERHGPVLDALYQGARNPDEPVMHAEWAYPIKRPATAKGARLMMDRRQFAEWGAGSAYLYLKANAKPDSNSYKALDGILRDEIYHFVLMQAASNAAYNPPDFVNVARLFWNNFTSGDKKANDAMKHRLPEPLMLLKFLYAFKAIYKRVAKFLKQFSREQLKEAIGLHFATEKELKAAVAAGKHTLTPDQPMEKNPDMPAELVAHYARRFPEQFDMKNRVIHESEVVTALDKYKRTKLADPAYWMKRKEYVPARIENILSNVAPKLGDPDTVEARDAFRRVDVEGNTLLSRTLEDGSKMHLAFDSGIKDGLPRLTFTNPNGWETYNTQMADMTMREIGCAMIAKSAGEFAKSISETDIALERTNKRAWIAQVVKMLSARAEYRNEPLPIIRDVTA